MEREAAPTSPVSERGWGAPTQVSPDSHRHQGTPTLGTALPKGCGQGLSRAGPTSARQPDPGWGTRGSWRKDSELGFLRTSSQSGGRGRTKRKRFLMSQK